MEAANTCFETQTHFSAAAEHISLLPNITHLYFFTTMRAQTPNCDDTNKCCTLRKLHSTILSSLTFTNFRSPSNLTTNFTETNPMLPTYNRIDLLGLLWITARTFYTYQRDTTANTGEGELLRCRLQLPCYRGSPHLRKSGKVDRYFYLLKK